MKSDKQKIEHNVCIRCGRKLKTEDARKRGMGIVCYSKYIHDKEKRLFKLHGIDN